MIVDKNSPPVYTVVWEVCMADYLEGKLSAVQGDITAMEVDAIVNAANSSLLGGGGVDGAIHRTGGPSILSECKKIRDASFPDGLPAGKAVVTGAGHLPAGKVIHTVGPVWHGGGRSEEETLARAYRNSLSLAVENNCRTVAFPAISTGVYGFPKKLAGPIAFQAVKEHLEKNKLPEKVYLVFFSRADLDAFTDSVEGLR